MTTALRIRLALLATLTAAVVGGFLLFWPAIPQPLDYHNFADQRTILGVPRFNDVASNLPFLIVGIAGLVYMAGPWSQRAGAFLERAERRPYWVYFAGLALTGIGSAYYHADPTNARLTWDRLPLTVAFMGLFTAVLAERISWQLADWLLPALVGLGAASVLYWHWSEAQGAGDLRPYLLVQFFPLLALPLLFLFFPARYTRTSDLVAALGCYVVAKALELLDGQVFAQGGIVSGHTLKHLVAGVGSYFVLFMLQRRRPITVPTPALAR